MTFFDVTILHMKSYRSHTHNKKRSHQARQISLTSSKNESKLAENESFHCCLTLAHSLGNSPIALFRE
jgi:hypothetical protein